MASGTIKRNLPGHGIGGSINYMLFDISATGNPYMRWVDMDGVSKQLIVTKDEIAMESNESGSWVRGPRAINDNGLFYYDNSDSYANITGIPVFGFITTGGTYARLYLILPKLTNLVNRVNITSLFTLIRTVDGAYFNGNGDVDVAGFIEGAGIVGPCIMYINLVNNNGWGVTNNSPVVGTVNMTASFYHE